MRSASGQPGYISAQKSTAGQINPWVNNSSQGWLIPILFFLVQYTISLCRQGKASSDALLGTFIATE
jgi:hypothetical protein